VTFQGFSLKTPAYVGELLSTRLALSTFSPVQTIIVIVYFVYRILFLILIISGIDYLIYIVFSCPADGSLFPI